MPDCILQLITSRTLGHAWEKHLLDPKSQLCLLGIKNEDFRDKNLSLNPQISIPRIIWFMTLIFLGFSMLCGVTHCCTLEFSP